MSIWLVFLHDEHYEFPKSFENEDLALQYMEKVWEKKFNNTPKFVIIPSKNTKERHVNEQQHLKCKLRWDTSNIFHIGIELWEVI